MYRLSWMFRVRDCMCVQLLQLLRVFILFRLCQ